MKERKDEFHTPFATKPFHCPAFLDEESKLPPQKINTSNGSVGRP